LLTGFARPSVVLTKSTCPFHRRSLDCALGKWRHHLVGAGRSSACEKARRKGPNAVTPEPTNTRTATKVIGSESE
jgi:hypothetical protein